MKAPPVPAAIAEAYAARKFREEGAATLELLAVAIERATVRDDSPVLPWREPAAAAKDWPADFTEAGDGDLLGVFARAAAGSIRLHHPRFVGHQVAAPLPGAALAELVGALLNNGMAVYEMGPTSTPIERAVTQWMSAQLGWNAGSGGVLTSGGSVGNLTALLAARQARAGFDAWTSASLGQQLAVLVSKDAHYSIARAVRIMGWGDAGAIPVAVDAHHRLDVRALDAAAASAASRGIRVIAVCAAAGSTATGAFDPLDDIADVCAARNIWLHVDGAHGASLALSPSHRHKLRGIERADSVVWDAHKMMMMPALVTAVLFRDAKAGYHAFAQEASYLFDQGRGDHDGEWWNTGLRTLECTKRMMALELYATLRAYGVGLFRDVIDRVIALTQDFAARVTEAPDFELALAPEANIICYRHRPAGMEAGAALDAHNRALRQRVVEDSRFYIVATQLPTGTYLRSAVMNPLTESEDLGELLEHIRALS